jgi:hypothetical protein
MSRSPNANGVYTTSAAFASGESITTNNFAPRGRGSINLVNSSSRVIAPAVSKSHGKSAVVSSAESSTEVVVERGRRRIPRYDASAAAFIFYNASADAVRPEKWNASESPGCARLVSHRTARKMLTLVG